MHTVSVSMLYEVQCLLVKSLFFFKPKQPTSARVYLRQRKWISLPCVWTKRYRSKINHISSFICYILFSFLYHLLIKSLVNQTKGESSVSLPGLKCKKKIDYHKSLKWIQLQVHYKIALLLADGIFNFRKLQESCFDFSIKYLC